MTKLKDMLKFKEDPKLHSEWMEMRLGEFKMTPNPFLQGLCVDFGQEEDGKGKARSLCQGEGWALEPATF